MTEKGSVCPVSNGHGFYVLYTHHLSSSGKEEEGKKEEGGNGGIWGGGSLMTTPWKLQIDSRD